MGNKQYHDKIAVEFVNDDLLTKYKNTTLVLDANKRYLYRIKCNQNFNEDEDKEECYFYFKSNKFYTNNYPVKKLINRVKEYYKFSNSVLSYSNNKYRNIQFLQDLLCYSYKICHSYVHTYLIYYDQITNDISHIKKYVEYLETIYEQLF